MTINFPIDVKNLKIKTNFDVKEAVDEFKKSIKCPDPQSCEIELSKEFYLNCDINFQNSDSSNNYNKNSSFKNETCRLTGNIY